MEMEPGQRAQVARVRRSLFRHEDGDCDSIRARLAQAMYESSQDSDRPWRINEQENDEGEE